MLCAFFVALESSQQAVCTALPAKQHQKVVWYPQWRTERWRRVRCDERVEGVGAVRGLCSGYREGVLRGQ